jgi:hypothetical protein
MSDAYRTFAQRLAARLLQEETPFRPHPDDPCRLLAPRPDGSATSLELTPFEATPGPATADDYFTGVATTEDLLRALEAARHAAPFEWDQPQGRTRVHPYAQRFLEELQAAARAGVSDEEAQQIAGWVRHLDLYMAVKAVESLLNARRDRALLVAATQRGWDVHFDHVAIRCGSEHHGDARRVVDLLCEHHGYVPPQVQDEVSYRFEDGWDAYPLYKVLDNGQVLRAFIDESSAGHPEQIIQHWNRVYGYTAHHLAMRATRRAVERRTAVPLEEVMEGVAALGAETMAATGQYTRGLLLQVFTRPTRNLRVPASIKDELRQCATGLEQTIENGKLIELVSRREMAPEAARELYGLYGLEYRPDDPLHSAPVYTYFLPAQAAHVIRTSVEHHAAG